MLTKWNLAALPPPNDTIEDDEKKSIVVGRKTLQQCCIDKIAQVGPAAVGRALHALEPLPHLQQPCAARYLKIPKRVKTASQLARWLADRKQMLAAYQAAQVDLGRKSDVPLATKRDAKLMDHVWEMLELASEQRKILEEAEADYAARVEDSWYNRLDGKRARRFMAMLEKYGW